VNFGWAIEQLKAGNAVSRRGWNGKSMFIVLMPALYLPPFNTQDTARKVNDRTAKWIGEDAPLDCQPYIAMYNATKQWQPGWGASQADMLGEDWELAPSFVKAMPMRETADEQMLDAMLIGAEVHFNHQPAGPYYKITKINEAGEVEIDGLPGLFAPHLFKRRVT
jgi:hypothetical protein